LSIALPQLNEKVSGLLVYKGPSSIDGKPIIVIATLKSANVKVGNLVQTWILREDMHPGDALHSGDDSSICGNCKHRGPGDGSSRSCYVNVYQAPVGVWRAYRRGIYPDVQADLDRTSLVTFSERKVRLGAYGDPAAVPYEVWEQILKYTVGHTGYTHQWKTCDQRFKNICMASVDTEEEMAEARSLGWRTFRVRDSDESVLDNEFQCPASEEQGKRKTCETCMACSGLKMGKLSPSAGSVTIVVHGSKSKVSAWNKLSRPNDVVTV